MLKIECLKCGTEFTSYNSLQRRYCSADCYWKSRKGATHSWGHKISKSMTGVPKTSEHIAKVAAALRIRKDRKCEKCAQKFYPSDGFQRFCSRICWLSTRDGIKRGQCKICKQDFEARYHKTFCSKKCYGVDLAKKRRGKNNPAYRNGFAVFGKRTYTGIHLRACMKYREAFLDKHGYPFCEVCKVNENGTPRFEVHHIYFASLYPKHPKLHDFRNLIHICIQCHNDFHGMKLPETFKILERERGLRELFGVYPHSGK